MSNQVLTRRQLNRAFLARQLLLERAHLTCEQAIEHLVGMQAQAPTAPYVGLWSRVDGFRFDDLASLYDERRVTRLSMMRSTIHLVTADDAHRLRPVLDPAMIRGFKSSQFGKLLRGLDLDPVIAAGRSAVEESPLTFAELGTELGKRWPTYDSRALAQAIRAHVALVQVPPRGIWGASGQARHTSLEAWLGRSQSHGSVDDLILRYLAAFGPASVNDAQTWSGLTRLRDDLVRLSPRLVRFRDENDVELFDLPEAPRPPADTPAPVRFLAEFDNALLSHADRTRIIDPDDRVHLYSKNGIVPAGVLVDGMVRAFWRMSRSSDRVATLNVVPFAPLLKRDVTAVVREGRRLLKAAAPEAAGQAVQIEAGISSGAGRPAASSRARTAARFCVSKAGCPLRCGCASLASPRCNCCADCAPQRYHAPPRLARWAGLGVSTSPRTPP